MATEDDFNERLNRRDSNVAIAAGVAEAAARAAARAAAEATETAVEKAVELARDRFHSEDMEKRLRAVEDVQTKILEQLQQMNKMANWWKGGFAVLVALGSIIMWFASVGDHVKRFFAN